MGQLDLFTDAPRDYHKAIENLARLDTDACRADLERHRRMFPKGTDPGPALEAAQWLDSLPVAGPDFGPAGLEACRALREGRAPGFSKLGAEVRQKACRAVARRSLATFGNDQPSAPLGPDLPWAVLHLFAGNPKAARPALACWAEGLPPAPGTSALSALALGDVLWKLGRKPEAQAAYRDGFGLAPDGAGWAAADPDLSGLRRKTQADPTFAGEWWVVGACVEGAFPPFGKADRDRVGRWRRRFEAGLQGSPPAPVLFFLGLPLSEQGLALGVRQLSLVRETLRRLHPEAYELHRERLELLP